MDETTHNGRTVYPYVSIHRVVRTNWRGVGIIEEVCGTHEDGKLDTYDEVGLRKSITRSANYLLEFRAPEIARASVLANSPKGYVE